MNILVCVKRVPLTGGKITLTEDEQAIQTRHLGFTVSPHEECAAEEAIRLVEAHGGESMVLTLGPAEAEEQLRDMMAIGIDRGIHLVTDGGEWDPQATAAAIVAAIRADGTPFDLHPVRQRVRRRRQLPGGGPRRLRARAAGGQRDQGDHAGRRQRCAASGRWPAGATSTSSRCRRSSRSRRASTSRAIRRSPAGCAPSASRSPRRSRPARSRGWRWCGSCCPAGSGKQAEVLGHGPEAAPRGRRDPAPRSG